MSASEAIESDPAKGRGRLPLASCHLALVQLLGLIEYCRLLTALTPLRPVPWPAQVQTGSDR